MAIRGAQAVARQARMGPAPAAEVHPALVNGAAGAVITMHGRPYAVMAFTVAEDKIVEIDTIADHDRVATLAASVLADAQQ
jgi:RNA polymerase sigma-70 factor (ECF subfamily)